MNSFFPKLIVPEKAWKVHASLCIHRNIDSLAMDSLIRLLCWPKPRVQFSRTAGDAMIDRARSQEATLFYNTDSDVLLFVDDDIQYEPEDAIKICTEAYERKTIVVGAYINKRENFSWITTKPLNDEPIYFKKDAPLVEVKWGATGFMAIHRNVLTDMIHELKLPLCHPTDLKFYPFFLPMLWQHPNGDHLYLSEDWSFCERARTLGYKIYLDPSVRLGHAGRYVYDLNDLCRPAKEDCAVIKYGDASSKIETSKDLGTTIKGQLISA